MSTADVIDKPHWIYAAATQGTVPRVMSVYRSIRTKDTHSWMRPVFEELEGKCVAWVGAQIVSDPRMMGGKAWELDYEIWDQCPGAGTEHYCTQVGESVPGVQRMSVEMVPLPRSPGVAEAGCMVPSRDSGS